MPAGALAISKCVKATTIELFTAVIDDMDKLAVSFVSVNLFYLSLIFVS